MGLLKWALYDRSNGAVLSLNRAAALGLSQWAHIGPVGPRSWAILGGINGPMELKVACAFGPMNGPMLGLTWGTFGPDLD